MPTSATLEASVLMALRFSHDTLLGMIDSLNFAAALRYILRLPKVSQLLLECVTINALLFGSLAFITFLLASLQSGGLFAAVWNAIFSVCWIVPMYAITALLGAGWYSEMYRAASDEHRRIARKAPLPARPPSFSEVSEFIIKFVVTLVYGIVTLMISFVPVVGFPISFVLSCWLHAYYCFDYRLTDQYVPAAQGGLRPITLDEQLRAFDSGWPYYFGFGSTHILCRTVLEFYGMGLFPKLAVCSTLFAFNVLTTVDASPAIDKRIVRLHVLKYSFSWFLSIFRLFGSRTVKIPSVPENSSEASPVDAAGPSYGSARPKAE